MPEGKSGFEELLVRFHYPLVFLLGGLFLVGIGLIFLRTDLFKTDSRIEVIEDGPGSSELIVEVSGAVEKPGVYQLPVDSRIEDALVAAGGMAVEADREWVERYLNRAAKISDGQKVYIPSGNEQSEVASANNSPVDQKTSTVLSMVGEGLVNINTASLKELDSLPGIGPVYGQNIIDQRPYSNTEELLSKSVLKPSVYEKIKDKISVY